MTSRTNGSGRRAYGTGHVYDRQDSAGRWAWYGKWRCNGKRLNRAIGPKRTTGQADGLTKTQAEAKLRQMMQDASKEAQRDPAPVVRGKTLGQVAREWIASRERAGRADGTIEDAQSALDQHIVPFLGKDTPVGKLDRERCEAFVTHLEGLTSKRTGRKLSAKTIRNYAGILSAMLAWAAGKGYVARNPASGVELPARKADLGVVRDEEVLWPDDVDKLVAAVEEGEYAALDRALYRVASMGGARQGECRGFLWQHIDFEANRILMFDAVKRHGRRGAPKSTKGRSVPMPTAVREALLELRNVSRWTGPDDPVFATPSTGAPMARTSLMERYRAALAAAGLPVTFRFHDLRHTFASTLARAGVPERKIQEWCGHSTPDVTRRYMHFAPADDSDIALVDGAFGASDHRTNRRTKLSAAERPERSGRGRRAA